MRLSLIGLISACAIVLISCSTGSSLAITETSVAQKSATIATSRESTAGTEDTVLPSTSSSDQSAFQPSHGQTKEEAVERPKPDLLVPSDFTYLGAFRLPGSEERPYTFAYGGEAMTFNPNGDSKGAADGFSGSLFVMGHNRMPYGELPHGNQLAEISICKPLVTKQVEQLPQAVFLQNFHEIDPGLFAYLDEIPRVGIEYLDNPATGAVLHLCWGQHFHHEDEALGPTHTWVSPALGQKIEPNGWYIGNQSPYSVNNYLFSVPTEWAGEHLGGRLLATGRFRDGGWSGMGPSLYAYVPWDTETGLPVASGTHLEEIVLLQYARSDETDIIEHSLEGYQHGDEWEGGAWITTDSGRNAVLFAGTKSIGERYWYGFINATGPDYPCLQEEFIGEFTLLRFADGTPCPNETDWVCEDPISGRGWWSSAFSGQFILYDPADLASVAAGAMEPWEPQPYMRFSIDDVLFLNPSGVDIETLGFGVQRRFRLGDVCFDRGNGLLYVLELFADEAKPVVHVWRIE